MREHNIDPGHGASPRRTTIALLLSLLFSSGFACSKKGGGHVTLSIHPGETAKTGLEIHTGEAEGGKLETCDLATLNTGDLDTQTALAQMDATVGKTVKSGDLQCAVEVDIAAQPNAAPGEYRLEVLFFYSFRAFSVDQEGDDAGSVYVTIL